MAKNVASTDLMKLCRDRAYYRGWWRRVECGHPNNTQGVNYVTGKREPIWLTATFCRRNSCGHEAHWFEPKRPLLERLLGWLT